MFDVGFWELIIIMIVALLVVGPERLPKLARTVGLWVGKGRRMVQSVKSDIDKELAAEELKKILAKQAAIPEVFDIIEETREELQATKTALDESGEQKILSDSPSPDTVNNDKG
ncbi:MAG: Sec-independent protein translocase protein TatB [Methylococcaceae bacterium]